jgi:hypothetical protein
MVPELNQIGIAWETDVIIQKAKIATEKNAAIIHEQPKRSTSTSI